MKRVLQAPNLALATLWADQLTAAGVAARVQRAFASGIAGELPPDQCLPEVWVDEPAQRDLAQALLAQWQQRPHRHEPCPHCGERIDGPFDSCWHCGRELPEPT